MGCDAHPEMPYEGIRGCDVAVQVKTPAEAERLFAALSEGGTVQMPIGETFWSGPLRHAHRQVRRPVDDQLRESRGGMTGGTE